VRRWFLKFHRWAGLAAGAWLLVLGATGIVLDHPEWRWTWQRTVPETWLSKPVSRLLRGTIMRYVVADPANAQRLLGGSERGLWWTLDGGATWTPVAFEGLPRAPLVLAIVPGAGADPLDGAWLATDDGLWRTRAEGREAFALSLRGDYLNSLTSGTDASYLLAVRDRSEILRVPVDRPAEAAVIPLDSVRVTGLPDTVSLYGLIFDLHFGEALLRRSLALALSDFAGVALVVLPITGFFWWWLPKRWKRATRATGEAARGRRSTMDWLYRFHAPVLGVVAAIPILYLSVTGGLLTQVEWLQGWSRDIQLERERLLSTYRFESLRDEVYAVVATRGTSERLSVATRIGVLHSDDGGASWARDQGLPASRLALFREGDVVFASALAGGHFHRADGTEAWRPIEGPGTGLTSATRANGEWILKNSRGFWRGVLDAPFALAEDLRMPALAGATMFLFFVDLHVGYVIHEGWKWVNVLVAILAVVLVISGPVLWWRAKWR
jgi:hypothetical protein